MNKITKVFSNKLIPATTQEVFIPAHDVFVSDQNSQLTAAAYLAFRLSLYSGRSFSYYLYHSSWSGGAGETLDGYGNVVQSASGWYIVFISPVGGTPPATRLIPDSSVTVPLGGTSQVVPATTETITIPEHYETTPIKGWNGSGVSIDFVSDICEVEFQFNSVANRGAVAGIASIELAVNNSGYKDILYGVYVYGSLYSLIESGNVLPGTEAALTAGDVFKIRIVGDTVTYLLNDTVIHASAKYDNFSVFCLDCSLYYSGDSISNAAITSTPDIEFFGGGDLALSGIGYLSDMTAFFGGGDLSITGSGSLDRVSYGGGDMLLGGVGYLSDAAGFSGGGDMVITGYGLESELVPPKVFTGGGSMLFYAAGSVNSNLLTVTLTETDPYFNQVNPNQIVKKRVISRKFLCAFWSDTKSRVEIPISSINGSLTNAGISRFVVVVPNGNQYAADLLDSTYFDITTIETYADMSQLSTVSDTFDISQIQSSMGAKNFSVTVTGTQSFSNIGGKPVPITGQSLSSASSGKYSITCSIEPELLPGDTVIPQIGDSFIVGTVAIVVNERQQFMSVTEA